MEVTFTCPYVFMAWCLVKHRDFTFTKKGSGLENWQFQSEKLRTEGGDERVEVGMWWETQNVLVVCT
jgi:hypothetical protein